MITRYEYKDKDKCFDFFVRKEKVIKIDHESLKFLEDEDVVDFYIYIEDNFNNYTVRQK